MQSVIPCYLYVLVAIDVLTDLSLLNIQDRVHSQNIPRNTRRKMLEDQLTSSLRINQSKTVGQYLTKPHKGNSLQFGESLPAYLRWKLFTHAYVFA